jgi:hypothetical protein
VWILTQFIVRMSFGMALGMALVSPRQVTSGYYRNHLYVLLGLNVLATLAAFAQSRQGVFAATLAAAVLSYVGAVAWLYEKPRAGIALLILISAVSLWASWASTGWEGGAGTLSAIVRGADAPSSGLVLGFTMAAMFLGHWYLNSPGMAIEPLKRLVLLTVAAVCVRAVVEAAGLALYLDTHSPDTARLLFVALRWLSGILGALALLVMTYRTLLIPNTQSATGILYVCVIATFLGELVSLLFGVHSTGERQAPRSGGDQALQVEQVSDELANPSGSWPAPAPGRRSAGYSRPAGSTYNGA